MCTIEIVGLLAILASLIFLAFELQQSNRIAVASTEIGIRNGYSEFNRGLHSGDGVAELMARAMEPDVEWTPAEEIKVLMVVNDIMNVWLSVETACDNELASESTCAELGDDIRAFIDVFTGTWSTWQFVLENYPSLAETEVGRTIRQVFEE